MVNRKEHRVFSDIWMIVIMKWRRRSMHMVLRVSLASSLCFGNVLPILSLWRKRSRDAETCTWAKWLRTDESSKTLGALTKRTRSTTVRHQNITTFLPTGGCIRNVFVAAFWCIRGVFGCIRVYLGVFRRFPCGTNKQRISTFLYIYIPNVSKALAIKEQKDEGGKKWKTWLSLHF